MRSGKSRASGVPVVLRTGLLLAVGIGVAASAVVAAAPPAHRHRLVGLAAKAAMMHASVLYHESAPGRMLEADLGRQNAGEIALLAESQVDNLHVLAADPANEAAAREVVDMSGLAAKARAEADSLIEALSAGGAGQIEAHKRAQRLFHIERQILRLHQEAEAKFGIKPPPDPPPLEPPVPVPPPVRSPGH